MPLLLNRALGSKCDSGVFQPNAVGHLDSVTNGVVAGNVVAAGDLELDIVVSRDQVVRELVLEHDFVDRTVAEKLSYNQNECEKNT